MNKRKRFTAGLSFGIGMAVFFILEELFTNDSNTSKQIIKTIIAGLVSGAVSGVLFGWLIGMFSKSNFVKNTTRIETKPGESILFETGANHFKGIEAVGGKLYLTSERLVFKSHKLNIQNHELSIDIDDIDLVGRYKPLGIADDGLSITTKRHVQEQFVVEDLEKWLEHLKHKRI